MLYLNLLHSKMLRILGFAFKGGQKLVWKGIGQPDPKFKLLSLIKLTFKQIVQAKYAIIFVIISVH